MPQAEEEKKQWSLPFPGWPTHRFTSPLLDPPPPYDDEPTEENLHQPTGPPHPKQLFLPID